MSNLFSRWGNIDSFNTLVDCKILALFGSRCQHLSRSMGKKSSDSMSSVTRMTGSSDLIPLEQKVAYAAGMLVNNLQAAAIPAMMIVLNLGIGLDPRLVGIIGFIPRIFDAVSDPLMGYISDNTRSPWGRRRPYIFLGAIISSLVFAGIWQFPDGPQRRSISGFFCLDQFSIS